MTGKWGKRGKKNWKENEENKKNRKKKKKCLEIYCAQGNILIKSLLNYLMKTYRYTYVWICICCCFFFFLDWENWVFQEYLGAWSMSTMSLSTARVFFMKSNFPVTFRRIVNTLLNMFDNTVHVYYIIYVILYFFHVFTCVLFNSPQEFKNKKNSKGIYAGILFYFFTHSFIYFFFHHHYQLFTIFFFIYLFIIFTYITP